MNHTLFLIFNHTFTPDQEKDARDSLGISEIILMPDDIQRLWGNIPPHPAAIGTYIDPIRYWLGNQASPGDYALIQGDFGACYLMVQFALESAIIPIYATTRREAEEQVQADGSVSLTHRFLHQRFRQYGQ